MSVMDKIWMGFRYAPLSRVQVLVGLQPFSWHVRGNMHLGNIGCNIAVGPIRVIAIWETFFRKDTN